MYLTIQDFNEYICNSGITPLSNEIQDLLISLEKSLDVQGIELSISNYQQSNHQQTNSFKNTNDSKWSKVTKVNHNTFNKKNNGGSSTSTNDSKTSDSYPNLHDKWVKQVETIGEFKITKIETKEGIEKTINEIRINLNKMTKKNYQIQKEKIFNLVENVIQLSNDEDGDPTHTNLQRVAQFIFDISSLNIFFSELYANLYKDLIEKYNNIFTDTLNTFILNYKESIQYFSFCDPNVDYEKYCEFVKEVDKKKATTTFITMLLNNGVILSDIVVEIINYFQKIIQQYINEDNRTNEIEELGGIIYILISLGNQKIQETNADDWKDIIHIISTFTTLKIKEYKSLSSRFIFKMKDLYDVL
jgi:hypothetical protein